MVYGTKGDMIEMFKIIHVYYDHEGVPHLQLSLYPNTRDHNKKLLKLQSHLDLRKYCFTLYLLFTNMVA